MASMAVAEGMPAAGLVFLGPAATLHWIENANHSFEVKGAKRPAAEVGAGLAEPVAAFLTAHTPAG